MYSYVDGIHVQSVVDQLCHDLYYHKFTGADTCKKHFVYNILSITFRKLKINSNYSFSKNELSFICTRMHGSYIIIYNSFAF